MNSHGRPLTLMSCDNIPANGVILANVVHALAERRGGGLAALDRRQCRLPVEHGRPHRAGDVAGRHRHWSSSASATATARSSSASRSANG